MEDDGDEPRVVRAARLRTTGSSVDLPGIETLRFRDGLIWRYRSVYDYSLVAHELGRGFRRVGTLGRVAV